MSARSQRPEATIQRLEPRVLLLLALLLAPGVAAAQPSVGTTAAGLVYEVSGAGEPVVLIHAFSVDRRMWAPQIAALEGRFRVVRYDLRGHGKSAAPSVPYAPHEDLRSVMDTLGIDRATLIGLSAGSTLAIDFAIAYPARVSRLVLASPGLNGHVPSPPLTWTRPVFEAAGKGDAQGAAKLWADTPIMALRSDTAAATTVRDLVMSNVQLWTYRANPAQPLAPPAIGRLGEVTAPALVILGGQDLPHIAEIGRLLLTGIRGARLTTIPGAGHIVNLDAREAFNAAMMAFLPAR
jgi:3-oxoadipate enol-lactonase